MASTSTNKQPLLIDRVFNEIVNTDGLISGNSNLATGSSISFDIAGGNAAKVLVNCTANDGALVEDFFAISRGASKKALFYLSSAADFLRPEQAVFVGSVECTATVGEFTNVAKLPSIIAPVPQVGNTTGLTDTQPLLNRAFYVPTGKALWVSLWGSTGQNVTNCPNVGASGGFF